MPLHLLNFRGGLPLGSPEMQPLCWLPLYRIPNFIGIRSRVRHTCPTPQVTGKVFSLPLISLFFFVLQSSFWFHLTPPNLFFFPIQVLSLMVRGYSFSRFPFQNSHFRILLPTPCFQVGPLLFYAHPLPHIHG